MFRDKKIGSSPAAAAAMLFFGCVTAHPGMAQGRSGSDGPIACGDFQRGPNGSWTVLRTDDDQGTRGAAEPGAGANLRQEPVCQRDRGDDGSGPQLR